MSDFPFYKWGFPLDIPVCSLFGCRLVQGLPSATGALTQLLRIFTTVNSDFYEA
jgi:hypothetical protein